MQGGYRQTDRETSLNHFVLGLEGKATSFDWDVSAGRGVSVQTNHDRNYYDATLWAAATGNGSIDPSVNTNDSALVASLKVTPTRDARSTLSFVDGEITGEIMPLPAGSLGYAVGASRTWESLKDTPDALTQAGNVVGSIAQAAVDASRALNSIYSELSIPVVKQVEIQAAVRRDQYADYGHTSPKLAVKYQPLSQITFRTSYSESFRAPTLKQLYGGGDQGAINLTADVCAAMGLNSTYCAGNPPATQVGGSRSTLKPETGKTWDFGVAFDFAPVNGTLDYWRIDKEDSISAPTLLQAVQLGQFALRGSQYDIFTTNMNLAKEHNAGVDLDLQVGLRETPLGRFNIRDTSTYYLHIQSMLPGDTSWSEFKDTYNNPLWRNNFSVSLENNGWSLNLAYRTVAGFWDTDAPHPIASGTRRVPSYSETDLTGTYSGLKGWKIDGGVKNAFNKEPPYSQTNASNNSYSQMGFAELYNNRGRFLFAKGTYTFK
jgi:iron complex outermembrane receptor protein